jgi:DNA primase
MGRIPEETIQTVRDRIDIVDLIGRHVTLKKRGSSHWGLCPFHDEKSPSFHVRPERGIYHCFGCGESGNAFDFLIRQESLTFPEAVRTLAAQLGVEVPESGGGEPGLAERLLAATAAAQHHYRAALASPAGAPARRYLAERGIDDEAIERFGIGFAPDRWDAVAGALANARIPAEIGARAGLLKERDRGGHYDLLRNRISFPIQDARGRVLAFGGRALGVDQEPKYLNSPESPIFRKRDALYGLPFALEAIRRADRAVVVEGYFDRIALHRAGIEEAVATCGTALGEGHARALMRRTRNVVLLFDGDEAGQRAVLRGLAVLLPLGLRVRAAALPAGLDPDDLLTRDGAEALRLLVEQAPPALDAAMRRAVAAGCGTPWEKADAVAAVAPLLAVIPDAVERGEWVRRLAFAAAVEPAEVELAVRRQARGDREEEPRGPVRPRLEGLEERRLAEVVKILVEHPQLASLAAERGLLEIAGDGPWRELLTALAGLAADVTPQGVMAQLEVELGAEPRALLHEIAANDERRLELQQASRALTDIAGWFDRRQDRARRHAVTDSLRDPEADRGERLREKNRDLERRRAALGIGTPPG